ncbi:MAG TPA: sigma factor-like helix-turn-helix DNA-binding protein, partial [Solirubrobacteraceae bacterium]|nr:sigma factor-like helix-turn-helix DNA-binding protein [Solirubrobacteraceae bacterium]
MSTGFHDGDPDAVRAVYGDYGRLVYAVAYRVLANRELAEQATQQTFVKAWRAASGIWEVRRALAELPADEQDVIRLQHFRGFTHEEIAERLDLPVGTIKSRSFRAHKRLATLLHHDEDRIAYLAGEPADSLTADERAELDELRALLESEETWTEPPSDLEDRVVAAVDAAAARPPATESAPAPAPAPAPPPAPAPASATASPPAPPPTAAHESTRRTRQPRQRSWVATLLERPA